MELLLLVAALIVLDVASLLWGADSRDAFDSTDQHARGWPFAPGQPWSLRPKQPEFRHPIADSRSSPWRVEARPSKSPRNSSHPLT